MNAPLQIAACVKWVDLRPEIDSLTGAVSQSSRTSGFSAADRAAVETALLLSEAWGAGSLRVVCAGPAAADGALRELLAAGATTATRVELAADATSAQVASALAEALADAGRCP